jgi:hypothetical protein
MNALEIWYLLAIGQSLPGSDGPQSDEATQNRRCERVMRLGNWQRQ